MTNLKDRPTCPKTGKIIYTQAEAKATAARWRRTKFARMAHFSCHGCKTKNGGKGWHIGNNKLKPKTRRR